MGMTDTAMRPDQAHNPLVNPHAAHTGSEDEQFGPEQHGQVLTGCIAQDPAGPNAGNMFFIQNSAQPPINIPAEPNYIRSADTVTITQWLDTMLKELHLPSSIDTSRSGAWATVSDLEIAAAFNIHEEGNDSPGFLLAQARYHDSQGLLLMSIIACTITCILTHTGKDAAFSPSTAYRQFCDESTVNDLFDAIKYQLRWGKDTFEQGIIFTLGTWCAAPGVTPLMAMPNHAGM